MVEEQPAHASHGEPEEDKDKSALHHGDHPPHDEPGYRDTIVTINGQVIDLAREPLRIEIGGFVIDVSYAAGKERSTGQAHIEHYRDYEIRITGAVKGEPRLGRPPGRLYINGKHIEYNYDPATGRIDHHGLFSVHYSLPDFARAYISANPNLADISHHP